MIGDVGRAQGAACARRLQSTPAWAAGWRAALLLVMVVAAGCGPNPAPATSVPSPTPSATATTSAVATLTPAPSPTPGGALDDVVLRLWLVEPLAPSGQVPAVLLEQLGAFSEQYPNVTFDVRVKVPSGPDGVLEVLRSTLSVAQRALPDLVLLGRSDLLSAAGSGVIQRLEGRLPDEILGDWFPVGRAMGTVNNELFGVAYVLDAQHLVYRRSAFSQPPLRLDDVLLAPAPYLFPAGISDTVVGQYLAGGGRLVDAAGQAVVDEGPLLEVLRVHEQAVREGIVSATVLEYDNADSFVGDFVNGMSSLAHVNASTYLRRSAEMPNTDIALVPAHDGPSVTVTTGWSWAMVTTDPDRQALALELLEWLMRPENLGAFSRASRVLPAQRTALQIWDDERYSAFAEAMLDDAVPRPASGARLTTARALQEALRNVLLERLTAEEAARAAANSVNPPDT